MKRSRGGVSVWGENGADTPLPAPEHAFAAMQEFEHVLRDTDLTDFRDSALVQWLQSVPEWVDWIVACVELSREHITNVAASPASTPRHSLSTPVSLGAGFFPSAPSAGAHRPRVADAATSLLLLATALQTVPWRRFTPGRATKLDAVADAFEAACCKILQCGKAAGPIIVAPVVQAALVPVCADLDSVNYVAMVAARIGPTDDADAADGAAALSGESVMLSQLQTQSSGLGAQSGETHPLDDELAAEGSRRVCDAAVRYGDNTNVADVDRTARILNCAAVNFKEKFSEVLRRSLGSNFPLPRWPVAKHWERYVELLLRLAALPHPPKGFTLENVSSAKPIGPSRSHSGTALSPQHSATDVSHHNGSSATNAAASATPKSPELQQSQPPLAIYPVAQYAQLLLDLLLNKLVDSDSALSLRASDAPHVKRLRRVVGHVAKLLQRAYRVRAAAQDISAETEGWLQTLFLFHQQHIMPVNDTKAVHMLVPSVVAVFSDADKAAFLHACVSAAEKSPAYKIPVKVAYAAHIGPLMSMLGGSFARRDVDDPNAPYTADESFSGIVRRLIKAAAKAHRAANVAGNDRFSEALIAQINALSSRFGGFPTTGKGDLQEGQVAELSARAAAPGPLTDIRLSVAQLYEQALREDADYGDRSLLQLKRLLAVPCVVEF